MIRDRDLVDVIRDEFVRAQLRFQRRQEEKMDTLDAADTARVRQLRDAIADNDRQIVKLLGARVALVRRLWATKRELGMTIKDESREDWLRHYLRRTNLSKLHDETVERLVDFLLDTTEKELGGIE